MAHLTATKELLERVDATNRRFRLFGKGDTLVVALSGGPDSTALLSFLSLVRRKYALKLHAAHLDHGLSRVAASHRAHARETARRFGAPFHSRKTDVKALARRERRSIEEAGRMARYAFLHEIARKVHADAIATAHTLDDQAETVLLRLLRGAGPNGLAGIRARRDERGVPVVRPFLEVEKRSLVAFLGENGTRFRTDPTNRSEAFTRNRVRHALIPYLEKKFNPRAKHALAALAGACAETQEAIEETAAAAYRRAEKTGKRGAVSLRLATLRGLHPAVLGEVLFMAAEKASKAPRLSRAHLDSLRAMVRSGKSGLETHLPHGLRARTSRGLLRLAVD